MTINLYSFHAASNAHAFEKRHIELCALDIMRVANLILKGREQRKDLHTDFARHVSFARRYNHEYYPDPAMDVEGMYQDKYNGIDRNFWAAFDDIHRVPRLQIDHPGTYGEIAHRVLSDSSPYLAAIMHWMNRALDKNGLMKYTLPAPSTWLLTHHHIVKARSGQELENLIERDMTRLRERDMSPAVLPSATSSATLRLV